MDQTPYPGRGTHSGRRPLAARACLDVAAGDARARYLAGGATPEASLTGQIAKRCRARTKHGQGASRQASALGRD
ncbi:hypothetical protein GCM10010191_53220 [Actinomadura vinacea]|uniref:Uncharacterized protein n=1 Tax=Actinomadura vinacea TaxID=115336 RepID=A0ABN3JKI7_9ACTN